MNIKRTIITTIVALALVAVVAPGVAQGDTLSDLIALVAQLQAQIAALQGGSGATPVPTGVVACAGVTFNRNLVVGSTGQDVKCLQVLMNTNGYTLAASGAGSPGMETSYFGPRTLAVVRQFQAAHGWTPANQVGPLTRQALNALLVGTPGTPPVVVPTGAGLTVQLAYDNPASGTLVSGTNVSSAPSQAGADLAHITFVNGDNAEVKVTNLKLKRIGVGADATLANVYLYDGAVRLTDAATVSSTVITFNDPTGLFKVSAGGSKTIRVLSDIALSSNGQTLGVQIVAAADVTSNASSIKGTFPVSGNLHTTATATLAGVSFGTATPSSTATVDPQDDYAVWTDTVTITTRAVNLTRFTIRQTGSVLPADLQNLRLLVDGVQAGAAVPNVDANGYATFDLSANPLRIETGARTVKVLANIVGGSSKNFIFSLRASADASFIDTQVGVATIIQAASAAFTARTTGTITINSGTITITKTADSPSGNVVDGAASAVLAKFQVKAAGERVKIETLDVSVVCSDGGTTANGNNGYLRNGALYANGVQIGSTANLNCTQYTTTYTQFSLGSALIVDPLTPVTLEVKADIYDNDGTNDIVANSTLQARIEADTSNGEGQVSKTSVNVPSADVDGSSLTVKQGTLTLAKYASYPSHTVVAPLTAYKLGHFTLTASTTENVNITTIQVEVDQVSSYLTNLYVKFGDQTTTVKPTTTADNSWSVNYTINAGQTKDVMVYGDVGALMTSSTGQMTVTTTGTTASSATAVGATGATDIGGQTLTFSSGSLTPAFASTPNAAVVAGGQQVMAGRFKFTALNDSYTITEMKILEDSGDSVVINSAILKEKDSSVAIQSRAFDTTSNTVAYFTGLSIAVPAGTTKYIDVWLDLATPSATNSTDYKNVNVTLDMLKYLNSQGTVTDTGTGQAKAANAMYVYKSYPVFTVGTLNATTAANGSQAEIYKFSVKAEKGDVALKQLKFDIVVSDAVAAAAIPRVNTFKFFRGTTDLTSTVNIVNASAADIEGTTSISSGSGSTSFYVNWTTADVEEVIPAGSTYTYSIKATVGNFYTSSSGNDSVSVNLSSDDSTDIAKHFLADSSTSGIFGLATAAAGTGTVEAVIWSDYGETSHGAAISGGAEYDWISGYLIDNLPLDVRSVSAQ